MADQPNEIDLNPQLALERIDGWIDGAVKLAPNIVIAVVVFFLFYLIAKGVKKLVMRSAAKRGRNNLGELLGSSAKTAVVAFGGLTAATVVFPSLNPGDIIAGLGVSSIAIGFAFKDILQNWLAGLLILMRQPFEIGDQIKIHDFIGTVQHIETRATIIRTFDGEKVVIPNSEIYTNSIVVKTARDKRRSQYDIGIGYGDDIGKACEVIRDTLRNIDGIEGDPEPEALPWDLAASWVTIRARWWTDPQRSSVVQVRADVIQRVKEALDEARIDMPYETNVHLMHDQTEASEGDRSQQREGWPAPKSGGTEPRWRAQAEQSQGAESTQREVSTSARQAESNGKATGTENG